MARASFTLVGNSADSRRFSSSRMPRLWVCVHRPISLAFAYPFGSLMLPRFLLAAEDALLYPALSRKGS